MSSLVKLILFNLSINIKDELIVLFFSIAFNVLYMAECLRNLDTKLVQIKMSEPLKPIVLSLQKDDNDNTEENAENKNNFEYLYLLMPVQLRN